MIPQKTISFFILLILLLSHTACEQMQAKQYAEKAAQQGCAELNELLLQQASSLVPVVGKIITDAVIPEDIKKGGFCECASPTLQAALQESYTVEELKIITEDKSKRLKAVTKMIFKQNSEILKCYEAKGYKGLKIIQKFLEKLGRDVANKV